MAHRFKVGDRVRLQRIKTPELVQRIGNDRFNINEEEFSREHAVVVCVFNNYWKELYHIDRIENGRRVGTWSVLEEMAVAVRTLVNPVTYRVQYGSDLYKREVEDGLSATELVKELIGPGSWEGVGEANPSMLRGERNGQPFTLLRV